MSERKLRSLEKLSLDAQRRMGLKDEEDAFIEKIVKEVLQVITKQLKDVAQPQMAVSGGVSGLRSAPPPGSRKVKNLFVTPDGKFQVDFEIDS